MTDIEIQNIVARIRRAQAETDKFVEEGRKLPAEAGKYQREQVALIMTSTGALLGAGAVIGGPVVRLVFGH